jgi:hypothetical protein
MPSRLPDGEASFNEIYGVYKSRAGKKGFAFELTKEQFKEITSQDCFYCGKAPSHISHPGRYPGNYLYNSIDREDNSRGYILGNCIPACGDCNKMRNTFLTVDEMKVAMQAVLEYRNRKLN